MNNIVSIAVLMMVELLLLKSKMKIRPPCLVSKNRRDPIEVFLEKQQKVLSGIEWIIGRNLIAQMVDMASAEYLHPSYQMYDCTSSNTRCGMYL